MIHDLNLIRDLSTHYLRVSFNGAKEELMDTIDLPRGAEFQAWFFLQFSFIGWLINLCTTIEHFPIFYNHLLPDAEQLFGVQFFQL